MLARIASVLALCALTLGLWGRPAEAQSQRAFTPGGSTSLSVTSTSANVALPSVFQASSVWLYNGGAAQAYFEFGIGGSIVATTSAPVISAGACLALDKGSADHLAAITDANPTTLYISLGTGVPGGSCPSQSVTVPGVALDASIQNLATKLDTLIAQAVALPIPINETVTGGTITAGGTFQSVLAANAARKGCIIFNTSLNPGKIFPGATAGAHSFAEPIAAGQPFYCHSLLTVETQNIDYTSTTTNDTFIVVTW